MVPKEATMRFSKDSMSLFPGSTGVSAVILVLGLVLGMIALLSQISTVAVGILTGLGSAMFLAGFLGLINLRVLAGELQKVTRQPFEEMAILTQLCGAGIEWVTRERKELVAEKMLPSVEEER